jgi:hypothetical protein
VTFQYSSCMGEEIDETLKTDKRRVGNSDLAQVCTSALRRLLGV